MHTLRYALFVSGGIIGGLMQTLFIIQWIIVSDKHTDLENIYDNIDIHLKKLARIE